MALTIYNIKKWTNMLTGKSISHVNQEIGSNYSKDSVKGYYNDLTEKVLKRNLSVDELPKSKYSDNSEYLFSIEIFQYGLGAYDLYLKTKNKKYLLIFKNVVNWAIENQEKNGGWISFEKDCPSNPYSSMAQGEGISLLARAYVEFKDKKYYNSLKRAMKLLMLSCQEGGTALYENEDLYFKEFINEPVVLNGWIFTIFGIYDYLLISNDKNIDKLFQKTVLTLKKVLPKFDTGYWSKYDINKKIASPFYHKLHSKLLYVLSDLTGEIMFKEYASKFEKYSNNKIYKLKAFIIKAYQKLKEKK